MAEKDDDKKTEEKLVPVGEGAEEAPAETLDEQIAGDKKKEQQEEASSEEADERVGRGENDEDEDDGPEGETVEEKRARRRLERRSKREKDARLRREVSFLRTRNEQLERQFSSIHARVDQQEQLSIDGRINGLDAQIRQAEQIHAEAVKQGDGTTSAEALKIKDELLEQKRQLADVKKNREQQAKERQTQPTQQRPSVRPEVAKQAQSWMGRNSWFDPALGDETSHLVKVMEDRLSNEGEFDPGSSDYWEELDRRVAERFPDLKVGQGARDDADEEEEEHPRQKQQKQSPQKKTKGGPRFSVGGRERALGKNEVYISAERRKALEDAGAWDDPVLRERYLKAYRAYDEDARNRNN